MSTTPAFRSVSSTEKASSSPSYKSSNQRRKRDTQPNVRSKTGSEKASNPRATKPAPSRSEEADTSKVTTTEPSATSNKSEVDDNDDDAEVCFICAEEVHYSAVTACNHRTCHICALRIRALYKNYACAYCKTESTEILFTLPSTKSFVEYGPTDIACRDEKLAISFEQPVVMEDTMVLLQFNCPVETCDAAANGWPDLKLHIKDSHNLLLCDLCVKNKKIFTHEHELFTQKALTQHYIKGSRDALDDNGFKGHPECGFCRRAFYDDDELYKHCRDKHERCHVCDQVDNGPGRAQYFQDYKQLDQHFRRDHFVCPEQSCLDQKFVVFASELDLKAHQLEAHPHGLSGQALKDARKVTATFATYEGPASARGNRGRRPEINFQSASSTSNGHMTREQQALHRQVEYQRSRAQLTGFGYALSKPDPPPAPAAMQVPKPSAAAQQEPATEAFPALGGPAAASASGSRTSKAKPKPKPKEQSVKARNPTEVGQAGPPSPVTMTKYQALLEKVHMITSFDEEKVAIFKTNIAQFRSTNITATELIDNLWSLFKIQVDSLGTIITGSADLLDSESKKQELLAAWNDWKVRNRVDTSVVPTSMAHSAAVGGGGQRILNIKSRASRTAHQTSSVWNQANSSVLAKCKDPIAGKMSALHVSNGRSSAYTPAWSASAANSAPNSGRSSPMPSNTAQRTAPATESFPSLPASSRSRVNTSQYFTSTGGWGSTRATNGAANRDDEWEQVPEEVLATGKNKKKPKKQILFSQGLQRG